MNAGAGLFSEVPIVDIRALVSADADESARLAAAAAIGDACRNVGFFYVANHGIPEEDCDALLEESRRFFALPDEEKLKLRMGKTAQFRGYVPLLGEVTQNKKDWHECIDLQPKSHEDEQTGTLVLDVEPGAHVLDDSDQWPEALPSFREVMMRGWDQLYSLSAKIAEGMALSLGLEAEYFAQFAGPHLCDLRLAHYPPFPPVLSEDDVDSGMGAHCDNGFLAVLQQDDVGGLEVLNAADEWVAAPRIPGTFLVNIGLMMQRWTNDRYSATWHRVQLPGDRDRYSTPFFFEPRPDAVIEPLEVCCDENNPPRYEPCVFGEYLSGLFSKAYAQEEAAP